MSRLSLKLSSRGSHYTIEMQTSIRHNVVVLRHEVLIGDTKRTDDRKL